MNYYTLGPTPGEEECAQLGAENYGVRMRKESKAYIAQLIRLHGKPPPGASLTIKGFPHDFGTYHEVVVVFDDSQEATAYANKLEKGTPGEWDEEARKFLELT